MSPEIGSASDDAARWLAAEQELQSFSYIVSHDLAASFRHVSTFSRLLVDELGEGLTERQRSHTTYLNKATENCQAMMEQLLAYSRVQQAVLRRVRQDAGAAVKAAMLQLSTQTEAAEAEVVVQPLGDVYADSQFLTLACRHVLDNALKFRRPDTPPRILIAPAHDASTWRMRVFDNGVGVAPPYREKAFQMFHRLHGEGAFPGVGAGLAISRRIACRHGGALTFLDCGEGACIELSLPRETNSL